MSEQIETDWWRILLVALILGAMAGVIYYLGWEAALNHYRSTR